MTRTCVVAPWCRGEEHFHARMRDIEGEIRKLGSIAANAVVWDRTTDTRDDVMRPVTAYAYTVGKVMHEKWNEERNMIRWNEHERIFVLEEGEMRKRVQEERLGWLLARQGGDWMKFER
jgi:hypothetical protein